MPAKAVKIVVDVILSFIFFIVAAIIINWLAGLIFGTKSNGDADFNGTILLIVTVALALCFGVWFYKYVHLHKDNATNTPK